MYERPSPTRGCSIASIRDSHVNHRGRGGHGVPILKRTFVIDSGLSPAEVVARLKPTVKHAAGFWGWLDFWLTWDGLSKAKFAGTLGELQFRLRRVHQLRLIGFVSIAAQGRIAVTATGSRITVAVVPTREELCLLALAGLFIVFTAATSNTIGEAIVASAVTGGVILLFWLTSRARETRETEALLRAILAS
jgi:hypothetical protein